MKKTTVALPSLYGDHHVVEVRRILLEIPGVQDVYASSAFKVAEISFDPELVTESSIMEILKQSGYTDEISIPTESGLAAATIDRSQTFFRHTAVYETTKTVVTFSQNVNYSGRPLWNCPGFGVIKNKMED
jgi:copper chaperone CopZ